MPSVCHDMITVAAGHNNGCVVPLGSSAVKALVYDSNNDVVMCTCRMSEKDPSKPKIVPVTKLAPPEPPFVVEPGDQTCKSCTGIMYLSKYVLPLHTDPLTMFLTYAMLAQCATLVKNQFALGNCIIHCVTDLTVYNLTINITGSAK